MFGINSSVQWSTLVVLNSAYQSKILSFDFHWNWNVRLRAIYYYLPPIKQQQQQLKVNSLHCAAPVLFLAQHVTCSLFFAIILPSGHYWTLLDFCY